MQHHLAMYQIFNSPDDFPGLFAVRRFDIVDGATVATDDVTVHQTLAGARKMIPHGLIKSPRDPKDPPSLVETWF